MLKLKACLLSQKWLILEIALDKNIELHTLKDVSLMEAREMVNIRETSDLTCFVPSENTPTPSKSNISISYFQSESFPNFSF